MMASLVVVSVLMIGANGDGVEVVVVVLGYVTLRLIGDKVLIDSGYRWADDIISIGGKIVLRKC